MLITARRVVLGVQIPMPGPCERTVCRLMASGSPPRLGQRRRAKLGHRLKQRPADKLANKPSTALRVQVQGFQR